MLLQSIQIKNYRSLEDITFDIKALDDNSFTFGLIGVNEAGKSSILKAMALKDSIVALTPKDFKEKSRNIEILYKYKLETSDDIEEFKSLRDGVTSATVLGSGAIQPDDLIGFKLSFSFASLTAPIYEFLYSKKKHDLAGSVTVQKAVFERMHRTVFWTAKDEYLISGAINLDTFAANPEISIPLKNSFSLAGIGRSQIPALSRHLPAVRAQLPTGRRARTVLRGSERALLDSMATCGRGRAIVRSPGLIALRLFPNGSRIKAPAEEVERAKGFEPSTFTLAR